MDAFCREESLAKGEPIAGSAVSDVDRWILLQYQPPFAPKAYAGAELPSAVRQHLDRALAEVPRVRLQLIRRADHKPTAGLAVYLGVATPDERRLLGFRLSSYEALLGVDLVGHLTGTARGPSPTRSRPLYLVCTHGSRDRCCAKWGLAVYHRLRDVLGDSVWQADHLGGHRFAANVLELPSGLSFGRLAADDVDAFAAARGRGELPGVETYRGRCAYSPECQAAEWLLLDALGRRDPDGFRLVESTASDPGWTVVFADLSTGEQHRIEVAERPLPGPLAKSCGAAPGPAYGFVRVS